MARGIKIPRVVEGFGRIERRKGTDKWYMVFRPSRGAKPLVRATGTADQQAAYDALVDLAGKYKRGEIVGDGTPTTVTFNALFNLLESDYRENNRKSTEDMIARVNKHLRPWFGKIRVIELRKRDVKQFVKTRLEGYEVTKRDGTKVTETCEPATVNKMLAYLKHSMRLGMKDDPVLVLRVPDWFQRVPGETVRTGVVDVDQYRGFRDALGEISVDSQLLFVNAYHTGMRRGALLDLKVSWWNRRESVIVIPPDPDESTKQKPREVPVYGEMRQYMEMARERWDPKREFIHGDLTISEVRTFWRQASKATGISGKLFHDLRRTAITNMEAAGIPRHQAMAISGHRTQAVYERYGIASRKGTQAAGRQMEEWLSRQTAAADADTRAAKKN